MTRRAVAVGLAFAAAIPLTACTSAADTANENLTKAAENFEVPRRILADTTADTTTIRSTLCIDAETPLTRRELAWLTHHYPHLKD